MFVVSLAVMIGVAAAPARAQAPLNIVAFGDSLTAGYGLGAADAFPVKLQKALAARGLAVTIANAGVSGDTSSGGLDRLDWSVPDGTQGVILELGANDALRGTDPGVTRAALTKIMTALKARNIPVFLCGMMAPPNYGGDYDKRFNTIYPDLARQFGAPLYPFFLQDVAGISKLNQNDGMHPTAAGVDIIVKAITPSVEAWLRGLRK